MKDKIREISIQLFEKQGFSDTSIQNICDALGVTKGTFYYYFTSKEELLLEIHLAFIEDILAKQDAILADEMRDSRTKLHDVIYLLIHSIERQGASARVFFREMRHVSTERLGTVTPKRTQFRRNIESLLRSGIASGEFRATLNPEIAAFGILGIANWSYQWFQPEGPVPDEEVARIFADMVLQGIEPRALGSI